MADLQTILPSGYELVQLSVASGTQITKRVDDVTKHLSREEPLIVSTSTRSRNANKLISIVEIAKRELEARNIEVFQYSALSSEKIQIDRKPQQHAPGASRSGGDVEDESDDAFETMGDTHVEGPKLRVVPVMTTYMSNRPVDELRKRHGEQR